MKIKQNKYYILTLLSFIVLPDTLKSQPESILLEGKYNNQRIIISANSYDGQYEGFYHLQDQTVCLEGSAEDKSIRLTGEKGRWDNSNELVMSLTDQGRGNWEVEMDRNDRKESFKAKEVELQSLKHPYEYLPLVRDMKRTDPFLYMVTCYHSYGIGIQGESLDISALSDSVKHIIENILMNEMVNSLQPTCYGSYEYEVQNVETCKNILRFEISAGWDGGAHPDFGVTVFQIDLVRNKLIAVEDIIDVKQPGFDMETIISSASGAKEAIEEAYRESGDECDYPHNYPGLSGFSCNGICVGYYFERVIRFCDNHCLIIIPFQVFKELGLLKSEFLYLAE
ncbi:MAG: hypothetical protein ABIJ16_12150 [Bacteroidota bacterium]